MATNPYGHVGTAPPWATVDPSVKQPDDYLHNYQHLQTSPDTFGAAQIRAELEGSKARTANLLTNLQVKGHGDELLAKGLKDLGSGLQTAGDFFNQVAADDAYNDFNDKITKILYGNPGSIGEDGNPDLGYFGLKGRAALDKRQSTEEQITELFNSTRDNLGNSAQRLAFDSASRRQRALISARIGSYADSQTAEWYKNVNNATADQAMNTIASMWNVDPQAAEMAWNRLRSARVKQAQALGGGPELISAAAERADREAVKTMALSISTSSPIGAMNFINRHKLELGADYQPLYDHLRVRAEDYQVRGITEGAIAESRRGYSTGQPISVIAPGGGTGWHLIGTARDISVPEDRVSQYSSIVQREAERAGVPADLIHAMIGAESQGKNDVISSAGARGIMQLMPADHPGIDYADPNQNIRAGTDELAADLKRYNGNVAYALAAYNWGSGHVDRWIAAGADPAKLPKETRDYIASIASNPSSSRFFRGSGEDSSAPAATTREKPRKWTGVQYRERFGDPDDPNFRRDNIVDVAVPWRSSDSRYPNGVSINRAAAQAAKDAFAEIWDAAGHDQDVIKEWGLDRVNDNYHNRNVHGTDRKSSHAWGMSMDFDAARNPYHPGERGTEHHMPDQVMDIFERHGFINLGRAIGTDYMHFQFDPDFSQSRTTTEVASASPEGGGAAPEATPAATELDELGRPISGATRVASPGAVGAGLLPERRPANYPEYVKDNLNDLVEAAGRRAEAAGLSPAAVERTRERVRGQLVSEVVKLEKAYQVDVNTVYRAMNNLISSGVPPASIEALAASDQNVAAALVRINQQQPTVLGSIRSAIRTAQREAIEGSESGPGPGFYKLLNQIYPPNGSAPTITSLDQLTPYLDQKNPDHLTYLGFSRLREEMTGRRNPDNEAAGVMKRASIAYAKHQLSYEADYGNFKLRDPNGEDIFNTRFLPSFYQAYEAGIKAGKTPYELLSKDSKDYIVDKVIAPLRRSPAQLMRDQQDEGVGSAERNASRDTGVDSSTKEGVIAAYRAGKLSRDAAEAALERLGVPRESSATPAAPVR